MQASTRTHSLPGLWSFLAGLGIIIAATALNLAHDRLNVREAGSPFSFLSPLYETCGKFGVTLLLVIVGMAVIILGTVAQRPRQEKPAANPRLTPRTPLFYSEPDDNPSEMTPDGSFVLKTRKYLQAGLSGTTSFPVPRAPKE